MKKDAACFIRMISLILLFSSTLLTESAQADLPNISEAIEARMHTEPAKDALVFIEERQNQVDQLTAESKILLQQTTDPTVQEVLSNAVEIFQGISSQARRLQSEWKKSADTYLKPPVLERPPYTIDVFNEVRTFQKEVDQQIGQHERDLEDIANQQNSLSSNLETLLFDYAGLKQSEADIPFALEKAAYIFRLQAKYSLIELRQVNLKKQDESILSLKKKGGELIRTCLEHIDISQNDIAARKEAMGKTLQEQENLLAVLRKKLNALDTNLLRHEVRLEALEKKLEDEENKKKKQYLKVEAKRIAAVVNSIAVQRSAFEQEKRKQKIKTIKAAFLYDQIMHYAGQHNGEPVDTIQNWLTKREELSGSCISIQEEILLFSRQKNQIHQKLLMATEETKIAEKKKTKESLTAFKKQLVKQQELIDNTLSVLLENQENINSLVKEIDWYLDLLRQEMAWYENLSVYFEKNLRNSWKNFQSVIYYPFFSFGQGKIEITIAGILKFIFLFLLGLAILQLIRRKTVSALQKKTRLSYGSVTSVTTLGYYFAVVFIFFVILNTVGINLTQLTVIFGALGIGIGFGLQTIMNNFISGVILLAERAVRTGDIVKLESGVTGEVKKVAIRSTIIRTVDGDNIIVPNSEFVSGRVNTWTYQDNWLRITIPFGVSYEADPDEVVRLAEETAREVEITKEDAMHPLRVFFEGYGESSLDFSIKVWCRLSRLRAMTGLRSEYYFVLFKKLKEAGIEIPFPQHDLHLRSVSQKAADALRQRMKAGDS